MARQDLSSLVVVWAQRWEEVEAPGDLVHAYQAVIDAAVARASAGSAPCGAPLTTEYEQWTCSLDPGHAGLHCAVYMPPRQAPVLRAVWGSKSDWLLL